MKPEKILETNTRMKRNERKEDLCSTIIVTIRINETMFFNFIVTFFAHTTRFIRLTKDFSFISFKGLQNIIQCVPEKTGRRFKSAVKN